MREAILVRTLSSAAQALYLVAVVALLVDVAAAAAMDENENATQSGCQICSSTGDCSGAYQGRPGQYCGSWLDRSSTRQSCCCPVDAVCKLSNYACNCAWAAGGRGDDYGRYDDYDYTLAWLWWLLGSLLLLLCCGGICFAMFRKREIEEAQTAYATPAYATPAYVSTPPPSMYGPAPGAPVYNAQPVYGVAQPVYSGMAGSVGNRVRSGMSAGTGAALGGGAGLLGGLLLGEAIADAGRGDYSSYGGGYDGGAGDVAVGGGDFGGDF